MKVKDIINELSKYDSELDIIIDGTTDIIICQPVNEKYVYIGLMDVLEDLLKNEKNKFVSLSTEELIRRTEYNQK